MSKEPNNDFLRARIKQSLDLRKPLLDDNTNAIRLINGEGDLLPGLVCDLYADTAVLQYDGKGPHEFWSQAEDVILSLGELPQIANIVYKPRSSTNKKLEALHGSCNSPLIEIIENNHRFIVDIENGQKTGFFFDQRDNRKYLSQFSNQKKVLNIFSYTGGFSIYAGNAHADHVTSLDPSCTGFKVSRQ